MYHISSLFLLSLPALLLIACPEFHLEFHSRKNALALIRVAQAIGDEDDHVILVHRRIEAQAWHMSQMRKADPGLGEPQWESLAAQIADAMTASDPQLAVRLRSLPGVLGDAIKAFHREPASYRRALVDLLQELGEGDDEDAIKRRVGRHLNTLQPKPIKVHPPPPLPRKP